MKPWRPPTNGDAQSSADLVLLRKVAGRTAFAIEKEWRRESPFSAIPWMWFSAPQVVRPIHQFKIAYDMYKAVTIQLPSSTTLGCRTGRYAAGGTFFWHAAPTIDGACSSLEMTFIILKDLRNDRVEIGDGCEMAARAHRVSSCGVFAG